MKTFTVVNTLTQSKKVFETDITTVDQLTAKLKSLGMDLTNTVIQESLSKTTLIAGKLLPHDVMYKGETTNNLVFRITLSGKKTDSGMSRQDIIALVKKNGWGEEIKKKFGKNCTNCKTVDLEKFIASKSNSKSSSKKTSKKEYAAPVTKVVSKESSVPSTTEETAKPSSGSNVEKSVAALTNILEANGYISSDEKNKVFENLSVKSTPIDCYTDEELDEIMG